MSRNCYILLTGQIRRFRHNWENLQLRLVKPNLSYFDNLFIIVNTWSDWSRQKHRCYDNSIPQTIDITKEELQRYPVDTNFIDFPLELDQFNTLDNKHRIMFYVWEQSLKYLENKYSPHPFDIVIKTRSDLWYKDSFNMNDVPRHTDNRGCIIEIPIGNDYKGINDQFAIGPHYLMKQYLSVYSQDCSLDKRPETILQDHLRKNNVPHARFPFNYEILR